MTKIKMFSTIIIGIVLMVLFIWLVGLACKFERTYLKEDCEVIAVEDNVVTVEDTTGNLWSFEDSNFTLQDVVTLTMDTNQTDNDITDDIIINVTKED